MYYSRNQLKSLFPWYNEKEYNIKRLADVEEKKNPSLYDKAFVSQVESLLPVDSVTGRSDDILTYVLSRFSEEDGKLVMSLLSKKVSAKSLSLSDKDKLELLVPKNCQTAGELKAYYDMLESYLHSEILQSKLKAEEVVEESPAMTDEVKPVEK